MGLDTNFHALPTASAVGYIGSRLAALSKGRATINGFLRGITLGSG
jgi:hypothetical protein